MSRCLADRAIDHVVLERGEVANTWRTLRADLTCTHCPVVLSISSRGKDIHLSLRDKRNSDSLKSSTR
jgi:hypothetical protein